MSARLQAELDRLATANPFEALGLDFEATTAQIRTTFLTLTKKYHPSRYARMDRPVVKLANEVFLRVKDAYGSLSDDTSRKKALDTFGPTTRLPIARDTPSSRRSPAKERTKQATVSRQPESQRRVRPLSGAQQIASAVNDTFQRRNADYETALKMITTGRYKAARTLFHKVAAEDPKTKKYRVQMHYSWGLEHEDDGRFDEARKEFERALSVDPEFKRAHEAIDRLPQDKKGSGFFSKIFGR